MRKHIPHPVTRLSSPYAELDILYGGNEADAIEESLKIACDLRDVLRDGEHILYVNTLVSDLRLSHAMGKRFQHGARRGRNLCVTYCSGEMIEKLPVLRHITEQRSIKYLVITGFELATLDPRHRNAFMWWLRVMRNEGVNVILFTISQPREFGALGALRYSARTVNEVGAYRTMRNEEQYENYEETKTEVGAVAEVAGETNELSDDENVAELEEELTGFADEPHATKIYAETPTASYPNTHIPEHPQTQHSDTESLETKDLALESV